MTQNTTFLDLYLNNRNITDYVVKAIAETLKTNTTLTTLVVTYCNIGSELAKKLVDAIKINTTLTKIYLYGNYEISNIRSYLRDNCVYFKC